VNPITGGYFCGKHRLSRAAQKMLFPSPSPATPSGSSREPPNLDKLGSGNPYHGNPQNLLRAFCRTLFPVPRTVIHSLAAASLPRQMEVVVTFVEKRPHPSRQKRLVHFVCFCTASTPSPTGEGIRLSEVSLPKSESESFLRRATHQQRPSPVGEGGSPLHK